MAAPSERVCRILASYHLGALTDAGACAELINLSGVAGADAVVPALTPELVELLRGCPLVAEPPASPDDVLVIESYCGPERSPQERERLDLERRETAYRGARALHRAIFGGGG